MIQIVYMFLVLHGVYSANILYIAPLGSPSHYLWNKVLALELVATGHNVTMLTHDYEKKDVLTNYTVITIEDFYEHTSKHFYIEDVILKGNTIQNILDLHDYAKLTCDYDFQSAGFQKLLNYPQDFKFDLIIFDITGPICLYGFISRFHNPPVIAITAFTLSPHLSYLFTNPLYTSYMPHFATTYSNKMTFLERTLNFIYTYFDIVLAMYISFPYQHQTAIVAFNAPLPDFVETHKNFSLFLINTDFAMDYPTPLLPNIIPVGGLQIQPLKPLSQDLENVFNHAEHGVIFFSLGTNINSKIFTDEDINTFLNVFSKLQEVVVWKFNDSLQNVPKNVFISKWLPQNDILGHPKTKLFITHCGRLSTQEAIYHAVPMVGIPYFIDQNENMARLINKGVAVYLNNKHFTFGNIHGAITEVLRNPKYKYNIKKMSEKFKNYINSPLDRAVFWVEHVLAYGAPDYLNAPSRDMKFYKINNVDVFLFLLLCLLLLCYIFYCVLQISKIFFKQPKIKTN
ncbi:hypothetical protein RN001_000167 [Aquatica leii]|uniref:UDP-glucuronosyltransferase n=1 Tax=Aquatica leii TaxID=1421715 RepID=A0AAN7PLX8_9COLE|nr:hypothetical protein RN001_000167 [Aquatica leii]